MIRVFVCGDIMVQLVDILFYSFMYLCFVGRGGDEDIVELYYDVVVNCVL